MTKVASLHRAWYHSAIADFSQHSVETILGYLTRASGPSVEPTQRDAWIYEIELLQSELQGLEGHVYFEFAIPRMGSRIDVVVLLQHSIYVIEFKVGARAFDKAARNQVWDYALDLKNFHEGSHDATIIPILVATDASSRWPPNVRLAADRVAEPLNVASTELRSTIDATNSSLERATSVRDGWAQAPYKPTPTIIEAARALFANHAVEAIARHDAGAENLRTTSKRLEELIYEAKRDSKKVICFVTGVPGAGKTLVGLNVATLHRRESASDPAVYLSGNGPLVAVLREALTRDEQQRLWKAGQKATKQRVGQPVKAFIQNVHHFRDDALQTETPPADHVVVFDEAQRAWNLRKTATFMKQKKGRPDFSQSEASFLISYLDRHPDWAVIVCLVGGGQEIHDGEAGISAWLEAARDEFPKWELYISSKLRDSEYAAGNALARAQNSKSVRLDDDLHLAISMRSFRAENVSAFVKATLDCETTKAKDLLEDLAGRYPIAITRDLLRAKQWVRDRSRGTERYGLVASSKAMRLKPHAIDVRVAIDPVHWFLDSPEDVRSSWYLEDCATEFQVQGLELDWACVTWDADLRHSGTGWNHHDFKGNRWVNIKSRNNQSYLKNAYRVLLTRARQGMVIFVPLGNPEDSTRLPEYYDRTYQYLRSVGLPEI
ncbi:MAG: hypothetical protein RLZZ200_2923 [Pseudomonadota bacterium]|jgi:DUF2075 family protein